MPTDNNVDETLLKVLAASYNLSDVDDLIHRTPPLMERQALDEATTKGKPTTVAGEYKYTRPGTFFDNMDKWTTFGNAILNESYQSMGLGSSTNILQNFLSRIDRHGNRYIPINTMNYGYTFITRPRLNMSTGNLLSHPVTALLGDYDPNSVAFMIRMLLDTRASSPRGQKLFNRKDVKEDSDLRTCAGKSGLLDIYNPFFTPLCNGLTGIAGWPDFNLEAATMGEDFHSGDFTFIKGCDFQLRTTELTLEFMDVQGSIILSCIFYWCLMMALQAKGVCEAYPDDIYLQRLNYTVSIYRFITDSTRRKILWWSKATGCFPKSAPIGRLFDVSNGEVTISAAKAFSIPFTANVVEYNNPGILYDFRRLMRNYNNDFDNKDAWRIIPDADSITGSLIPDYNFIGLPDIIGADERENRAGLELVWKTNERYSDNWPVNRTNADSESIVDKKADELAKERLIKIQGTSALSNAIQFARNNSVTSKYDLPITGSPANGNSNV